MGTRDLDWIDARLLSPAPNAVDAINRLRERGFAEEADRLFNAVKAFMAECRQVRVDVLNRNRDLP